MPVSAETEFRISPADWPTAVADTDGYQVVVAGPGTGKTEFLVKRVTHLIESGVARRDEILVICFSRRSARALRERIDRAVGRTGVPIDITTYHSLALRISETLHDGDHPIPLTTPEQVGVVAEVLRSENPADWPLTYRAILDSPAFATEVADFLMRCSERLLSPDQLAELAAERDDWRGLPGLHRRYLERLEEINRTDYGVLLANTVRRLESTPHPGYRYVLVDEYQDTTPAQARFSDLLASHHGNLTVTGDPYQSTYSFRGAEVRNIADFSDRHPGSRRIILTQSFRVPAEILTAALRVISGGDLPGAAGPVTPAPHVGRTETYVFDQITAEAEWIADQVQHAILVEEIPPSRIAVLVRSKRDLITELSRALARRNVPHDPPQSRLVDHPAVALVRDLATVAIEGGALRATSTVSATNSDRAMRRVLLGPVIGLGLGRERSLARARRRTWEPWSHVIKERLPETPGLATLLNDASWATEMSAVDGFWHLWTHLDGLAYMVADPARSDWRRAWAAFAQTLARQAERDPRISLTRYFALTDDDDFEAEPMISLHPDGERVTLTTLHQAKGLEFEVVFIANASEGVFPDLRRSRRMLRPELLSPERTTNPDAQHMFQVQEEMRLAYTAMTRARSRVVWTSTSAAIDQGEGRPSRFLVAASGVSLDELGPPQEEDRDPVTRAEAEIQLRRWLLDPTQSPVRRLTAATLLARHTPDWWDARRFAGVPERGPDSPLLHDQVTLSPSQADSYKTCPRRYALERRLHLADNDNQYLQSGSLIHEALERAENEILGSGQRHNTVERALEILEEVWEEADFGTPELNAAHLKRAKVLVERLYTLWPAKSGEPVAVEHHVEVEIAGVPWRGVIDRVERSGDGVRIVDYKTGGIITKAEAAEALQLAFYAMAWQDTPVLAAEFWYPKAYETSVGIRTLDMANHEQLIAEMETITRSILGEDWTPKIGDHCGKCSFRGSCPAWPEGQGAFVP